MVSSMVADNDNSMDELQQRVDAEKAAKQAEADAKRKEAEALNKLLTPKEYRFCQEYVKDLNGARAARDAGYSENSATPQASRMLTKANIKARIADMQRRIAKMAEIDATYVLTNIKEVGERCMVKEDFNPTGAIKSLELLGKHLKLFTDKLELDASESLSGIIAKLLKAKT